MSPSKVYVCVRCDSPQIEVLVWQDANTDNRGGFLEEQSGHGMVFCRTCKVTLERHRTIYDTTIHEADLASEGLRSRNERIGEDK